jgi:2-iminobutanoate/2-iminopropanoate deaminase
MKKEIIFTEKGPRFEGMNLPFSQATAFNDLIFVSGQVSFDPETDQLVQGDFEAQLRRTLDNIRIVLEGGGSSLDNVLKVTVFLTDMGNFSKLNDVYREYFPDRQPARSAFQVAALAEGLLVEIECIACRNS